MAQLTFASSIFHLPSLKPIWAQAVGYDSLPESRDRKANGAGVLRLGLSLGTQLNTGLVGPVDP
ncbi:hypothetical protein ACX0GZ_13400 [Sphingomonas aestuarii]